MHILGTWENKFDKFETDSKADFHVSRTEVVKTKMMRQEMWTRFTESSALHVKLCSLAYRGPPDMATEMVIILPLQLDGLAAFEVRILSLPPQVPISKL